MIRVLTVTMIFLFTLAAQARIEVAFIEIYHADGSVVELEPGGHFAHMAIAFKGRWLHSHPYRGVELIDDLSRMGSIKTILVSESAADISDEQVHVLIGRRYDSQFDWSDDSALYCSELVAKLLGLPPFPMSFDSSHWRQSTALPKGKPGISPDEVHLALVQRGYAAKSRNSSRCEDLFR